MGKNLIQLYGLVQQLRQGSQQGQSPVGPLANAATKYGVENIGIPYAKYATGLGPDPSNIPNQSSSLGALLGYGGGSTGGTLASGPVGGLLGNYLGVGTEAVASSAPVAGAEAATMFGDAAVPAAYQAGAAGAAAGGGASSLASMGTVYAALPAIAALVGSQLQKSGSPQLKATGRGLTAAGQPIPTNPFGSKNVKNPVPELRGLGESLLVGGPGVSAILKAVGWDPFHGTPTHGTSFREALKASFKKQGVGIKDWGAYNIDPDKFSKFDPQARAAATQLGQEITKGYKDKRAPDYAIQTQNLLMNNLTPQQILELSKKYQSQTQAETKAPPIAAFTESSPGLAAQIAALKKKHG